MKTWLKILLGIIIFGLIAGGIIGAKFYTMILSPNVELADASSANLFIPSGAEFSDVVDSIKANKLVKDVSGFKWVADKKNYANHIYPGRYVVKNGMNNNDLVNLLRSGSQTPVQVTFSYARLKEEVAGKLAVGIEADSIDIVNLINNRSYIEDLGFTSETIISMFIPNTYNFNWSTDAKRVMERMKKEYDRFWNEDRKSKAESLGMTQQEVSTLASIVQSETNLPQEQKRIAGVYVNRLDIGMALEADPTLVFALGDFSIRRVLDKHKAIDSPYNTYKYPGLPPGPICLPQVSYIDAVLDFEDHEYLFFCAREDFSGYSNFAKTYAQHLVNARKYHRALNDRKIFR
ncbi:MAG: endolytic transglycosylase MltG [Bacteroidota bacterium]